MRRILKNSLLTVAALMLGFVGQSWLRMWRTWRRDEATGLINYIKDFRQTYQGFRVLAIPDSEIAALRIKRDRLRKISLWLRGDQWAEAKQGLINVDWLLVPSDYRVAS